MALRQAYSLSSIWMSRKGFTSSSKILVATRAISSSGQCMGMMKSFPGEMRNPDLDTCSSFADTASPRSHPDPYCQVFPLPTYSRFPVCSFMLRLMEKQAMDVILWSLIIYFARRCSHTIHKACSIFCSDLPSVIPSICLEVVLYLYFWCIFLNNILPPTLALTRCCQGQYSPFPKNNPICIFGGRELHEKATYSHYHF